MDITLHQNASGAVETGTKTRFRGEKVAESKPRFIVVPRPQDELMRNQGEGLPYEIEGDVRIKPQRRPIWVLLKVFLTPKQREHKRN